MAARICKDFRARPAYQSYQDTNWTPIPILSTVLPRLLYHLTKTPISTPSDSLTQTSKPISLVFVNQFIPPSFAKWKQHLFVCQEINLKVSSSKLIRSIRSSVGHRIQNSKSENTTTSKEKVSVQYQSVGKSVRNLHTKSYVHEKMNPSKCVILGGLKPLWLV